MPTGRARTQVAAQAGGELLRGEAMTFSNAMGVNPKKLAKGAQRLKEALLVGDDPLLVPLLTLVAQVRSSLVRDAPPCPHAQHRHQLASASSKQ
jgi:hypothetical protein